MTPETQKMLMDVLKVQPQSVAAPLSPFEQFELERSQLSNDPVVANLQRLGRGIKGFLVPETPLDIALAGVAPAKAVKGSLDIAKRLENAKKMGFDIDNPVYHGSGADIKSFRLPSKETGQTRTADTGIFFSDSPRVASSYNKITSDTVGPSVYPVVTKNKDYLKIKPTEKGMLWSQLEVNKLNVEFPDGKVKKVSEVFNLDPDLIITTDELAKLAKQVNNKGLIIKDVVDSGIGNTSRFIDATDYLNKLGYRAVLPERGLEAKRINAKIPQEKMDEAMRYAAEMMEKPSDITVAFDPTTVRSIFAKFDPKKKGSADILAGASGLSLLGVASQDND